MPKKLRTDDDNLMEIFQQHYAELRREHSEYEVILLAALACMIALLHTMIAKFLTQVQSLLLIFLVIQH